MYRQLHERAGISIEQGTDNVPTDGKYYVFKDGKIVRGFRSLKAAQAVYHKLVEDKGLLPLRRSERVSQAEMLGDAWTLRSNKSLLCNGGSPKGKKGGRFHKVR